MTHKQFWEVATGIFKKNPGIKELHFTDNGQAFTNKLYAEQHAKQLGNKEIVTITPGQIPDDMAEKIENDAKEIFVNEEPKEVKKQRNKNN
jgi:hypothetical protein